MKKRYLLLLGLLGFVPALLLGMPAATLYGWLQPAAGAPIQLQGIHGTLADGGAAALVVRGRPTLRELSWKLNPAWLAVLRLELALASRGDAELSATVSRTPFGATRLHDVRVNGPVKAVLAALGQPALPVEGQLRLELPVLTLDKGAPVAVEGSAEIDALAWTLAREPLPLGSFNALLDSDDKGVTATFGSGAGPLELGGTATVDPARAYELHLQLRPRPEAQPALQTLVRSLGAPDSQGWYHLRRKGTY